MNIHEITKLFDLEYFDGPLLSLFTDKDGNFLLFKWYDIDVNSHHWLVFNIEYEALMQYLNGGISEFDLINDRSPKPFYLVEFSKNGQPNLLRTLSQQNIIHEFEGLKTIFFDAEMCPNWNAVQHFFVVEKASHTS